MLKKAIRVAKEAEKKHKCGVDVVYLPQEGEHVCVKCMAIDENTTHAHCLRCECSGLKLTDDGLCKSCKDMK